MTDPTTFIDNDGYETAILIDNHGTAHYHHIHDLIADTFNGPRPDGHTVEHIDGNKRNNRADNLRYVKEDA